MSTIDSLKLIDVQCGSRQLKDILDTGAQISVIRSDLAVDAQDGERQIKIISAFGEAEVVYLKSIQMKINDGNT